jgi:hypothetical protein
MFLLRPPSFAVWTPPLRSYRPLNAVRKVKNSYAVISLACAVCSYSFAKYSPRRTWSSVHGESLGSEAIPVSSSASVRARE